MADNDPQNTGGDPGDGGDGGGDTREKQFWDKLGAEFDKRADAAIDRAIKKFRVTGSQRGNGRTTIPGVFADFMFGKQQQKQD